MAVIVVMAAIVGIAWNHKLLYLAWTGQARGGMTAGTQPQADIPLPLGLMQVKELYDAKEALFVDARDAGTFAAGHIAGAVSLPVGEFDARLPRFRTTAPAKRLFVVYCNGYDCRDSRELGIKLLRAGYRAVYVFDGGFPEWRDAGYPAEGGKR
jgi:rhodanese-related sulfurtransferase